MAESGKIVGKEAYVSPTAQARAYGAPYKTVKRNTLSRAVTPVTNYRNNSINQRNQSLADVLESRGAHVVRKPKKMNTGNF